MAGERDRRGGGPLGSGTRRARRALTMGATAVAEDGSALVNAAHPKLAFLVSNNMRCKS